MPQLYEAEPYARLRPLQAPPLLKRQPTSEALLPAEYVVPSSMASPLQIVHVVRQFYPGIGGVESVVMNLARQQVAAGHDVRVVTLNRLFTDPKKTLPERDMVEGVEICRIPYWGSKRYPIASSVNKFLKDRDVIHVHNIDFFADWLALTARKGYPPIIVSTHGGYFHTKFAAALKKLYFSTVTKFSLRRHHAIICISHSDHNRFEAIVPRNSVLLENGVDLAKFHDASSATPVKTIVSWSRWSRNKRIDRLIEMFMALRVLDPEWRLILAGMPSELGEDEIREMVRKQDVEDAVDIIVSPNERELKNAIGRASIFVSSSDYEGFGLSTVEAMSAGLVPIVSDISAHRAILDRAGLPFYVSFRSPLKAAELVQSAWRELAASPAEVRSFVIRRSQRWHWSATAQKTVAIYRRALGSTRRNILGVNLTVATEDEAVAMIDEAARLKKPIKVAFANAHTLTTAKNNEQYQSALKDFCVLNDGVGVDWSSKQLYKKSFPANLNGTDFVPKYFEKSKRKHKVFLFGAGPGVAQLAARTLSEMWQDRHEIVGTHHGKVPEAGWSDIAHQIRASGATLVLVAMGNPKQEMWLHQHFEKTDCQVGMGVGALFDFLSGRVTRAPAWIRRLRLEWAYRVAREPLRLGRRYLIGGVVFARAVLKQKTYHRI